MLTKKTVTIGIPAHNEERTIVRLLDDIFAQKQNNCVIERVIVACDGCSDNTAGVVRSYSVTYPIVEVIDDGGRLGQGGRLSMMHQLNESDIFITFDADTRLGSDSVVDNLVNSFDSDSVGLVAGYDLPHPAETFAESVIITGIEIWYETRRSINQGDSVHNHHGCVSALSKEFARQVRYVTQVTSNDEFVYIKAKQLGYEFRFCTTAPVYYRVPSTISDYLRQYARFTGCYDQITEYFGSEVASLYAIPSGLKLKAILTTFLRKPLVTPFALLLLGVSRFTIPLYKKDFQRGLWTVAASTKR